VEETNEKKNVFNLDRKNIPFFCKKNKTKAFELFFSSLKRELKPNKVHFTKMGCQN